MGLESCSCSAICLLKALKDEQRTSSVRHLALGEVNLFGFDDLSSPRLTLGNATAHCRCTHK